MRTARGVAWILTRPWVPPAPYPVGGGVLSSVLSRRTPILACLGPLSPLTGTRTESVAGPWTAPGGTASPDRTRTGSGVPLPWTAPGTVPVTGSEGNPPPVNRRALKTSPPRHTGGRDVNLRTQKCEKENLHFNCSDGWWDLIIYECWISSAYVSIEHAHFTSLW